MTAEHPAIRQCQTYGTAAADANYPRPRGCEVESRRTDEDRHADYCELLAGERERDRNVELNERMGANYERRQQLYRDHDAGRIDGLALDAGLRRLDAELFVLTGACRDRVKASQVTAGYFPAA